MARIYFNDKRARIEFALAGTLLTFIFLFSLLLERAHRDILLEENGLVESASALGYLVCAAYILYKGGAGYLRRGHAFLVLIIFFMFRELDYDKRFTTMGILMSRFYISPDVPLVEKIAGGIIVLLLSYIVLWIIYNHYKDFWSGLKNNSVVSLGVLAVLISLLVSKTLDGLSRKLRGIGVELDNKVSLHAEAAEEIIELGIPIFIFLTFRAYFHSTKDPGVAAANAKKPRL